MIVKAAVRVRLGIVAWPDADVDRKDSLVFGGLEVTPE